MTARMTEAQREIQNHTSWGTNSKVSRKAMVFNAGNSTHCISQALGLCQVPAGKCFMQQCEAQYPDLEPYHTRQGELWRKFSPQAYADALLARESRARVKQFVEWRYGESGDFKSQAQVDWFAEVSRILRSAGKVVYGYTARTDLDLTALIANSQVNLSNDANRSLEYQKLGANRFDADENPETRMDADAICPCEKLREKLGKKCHPCEHCNLCKVHTGKIVEPIV